MDPKDSTETGEVQARLNSLRHLAQNALLASSGKRCLAENRVDAAVAALDRIENNCLAAMAVHYSTHEIAKVLCTTMREEKEAASDPAR